MSVRIYAHRGASAERPENTMAAFRRAVELGVDALELDIHATADGVLVVSHDGDGRRRAGVDRRIGDLTWAEASRWDVGAGERMPTFEEVVTAFPTVRLNVDLKHGAAEAAIALLRRFDAEERTCLASFQMRTMERVRALGYRGPTALSRAEALAALGLPATVRRGRFRCRAQRAQLPVWLARPWIIARMKALGLDVDFWTVDDPALAQRLVAMGADGIMTNDPARIVPALGR
ncbi:MAG: Glycerophosphoryl diester phosphodiesterase [Myxococcales bacterium]|nr:Glycerophosphoryl diester phosphodiesterase [Myxococcales bacterium]